MATGKDLDAHEKPPIFLKNLYKLHQRRSPTALESDGTILDLSRPPNCSNEENIVEVYTITHSEISAACCYLQVGETLDADPFSHDVKVYEARNLPGKGRKGPTCSTKFLTHYRPAYHTISAIE